MRAEDRGTNRGTDRPEAAAEVADSAPGSVQSVDRAGRILSLLADRGETGVTEIAAHLQVHKSTAFRILQTLEAHRLVEQDRLRGGYRLGIGLVRLGHVAAKDLDVTVVSRAECERLAAELGEAVNVAVRDGAVEVNVLQVSGPATVGTRNWVGQRTPLYATSTGKVLLIDCAPAEVQRLIGARYPALTDHTITTAARLSAQIATARQRGYATSVAELELGLNAVAVPVRSATGAVAAALSVSGPSYRLTEERFAEIAAALSASAAGISRALGYADGEA